MQTHSMKYRRPFKPKFRIKFKPEEYSSKRVPYSLPIGDKSPQTKTLTTIQGQTGRPYDGSTVPLRPTEHIPTVLGKLDSSHDRATVHSPDQEKRNTHQTRVTFVIQELLLSSN